MIITGFVALNRFQIMSPMEITCVTFSAIDFILFMCRDAMHYPCKRAEKFCCDKCGAIMCSFCWSIGFILLFFMLVSAFSYLSKYNDHLDSDGIRLTMIGEHCSGIRIGNNEQQDEVYKVWTGDVNISCIIDRDFWDAMICEGQTIEYKSCDILNYFDVTDYARRNVTACYDLITKKFGW